MIQKKMIEVMRDVSAIGKNKVNQMQRFNFRGIDDVYNHLHGIMAKHGVFCLPEVIEESSEERKTQKGGTLIYRILKIKYTFMAEDGSSVSCTVIGEGMDSGDKASNKGMAIAHKYALTQVFIIPTEDMIDPDAESHEIQSEKNEVPVQKKMTDEYLESEKLVIKTFLKYGMQTGNMGEGVAKFAVMNGISKTARVGRDLTEEENRQVAKLVEKIHEGKN